MSAELADHKCVPCTEGTRPLAMDTIAPLLEQLEGWKVEEDKKLAKPYKFRNFVQAVDFVNSITQIAEEEGHHPDLYVEWGKVTAYLWTHKINGLADADFVMAAKIDRLYSSRQTT